MKNLDTKTVYETKDYDLFVMFDRNRPLKNKGRKFLKLKDSISNFGLINPIIIDNNYLVVDGQHRLDICKQLNISVSFIYRPDTIKALTSLSNDRENWQVENYAFYYSNNPSYNKLLNYRQETRLSLNAIHALIKGKEIDAFLFKSGKFSLNKQEEAKFLKTYPILEEIVNLEKGIHKKALTRTRVISSLSRLISHGKYNHKHFVNKLRNKLRIPSVNTKEDAVNLLLDIYNKNLSAKNKISLG